MPLIRDVETETLAEGRTAALRSQENHHAVARRLRWAPGSAYNPPSILSRMFGFKPKNPEEHRYYLLPGQGRGAKHKRRVHMIASLVTAALVAAGLSALMWYATETR